MPKDARSPIAAMISVPFQHNRSFGYGTHNHIHNVLKMRPALPFGMNEQ
ncbi:MAG: hypothetical protein ING00_08785 [Roseomonas sp.]|jgi:hypothetical protein|nr:hypothetical protein [Roseomonas sp.]